MIVIFNTTIALVSAIGPSIFGTDFKALKAVKRVLKVKNLYRLLCFA